MQNADEPDSAPGTARADSPRSSQYCRVLDVPEDMRRKTEDFYSKKSQLIVLQASRGPVLARYPHPKPPDRSRHLFFTTYPEDYVVFEGSKVPTEAPHDVEAVAWPVQRGANPVQTVASGNPGMPSTSTSPDQKDVQFTSQNADNMIQQKGMRVGPNGTHVHGGQGASLAVDKDGTHVKGGFEQTSPEKRGATQQSPAFGIVPKSAVTFPGADYIPNTQRVQELKTLVQTVQSGVLWVARLATLLA